MRVKLFFFIILLTVIVASADLSFVDEPTYFPDANIVIVPPQYLSPCYEVCLTIYNSTEQHPNSVNFTLNLSWIRLGAGSNVTVGNITYNNATDIWRFNGTGTGGYLNITARVTSASNYDLNVNGTLSQTKGVAADNAVWFNVSGFSTDKNFSIQPTSALSITSWGNNITNSESLLFSTEIFSPIRLNATANQGIITWNWDIDSTDQNNNQSTFDYRFNTHGTKAISVSGTNGNGTTNTLQWSITPKQIPEASVEVTIT